VNDVVSDLTSPLRMATIALGRELSEIELSGSRAHHCLRTTLAVALAVILALLLRVDAPWWAAISAFVSVQVTAPSSLERGALRIMGTAIGAAVAVAISPWLIEDRIALSLVLFAATAIAVLGLQVSSYGYAFVLAGVTVAMVLLAALDDPNSVLEIACNRTAEVTIGTVTAVLVSILFSPDAGKPARHPLAPGWSELLGEQWPSVLHAMRAGLGVMLVPWVWNFLELPSLSQTAITVTAVMAVQTTSADDVANRRSILTRATHRILGCVIGGVIGLAVLSLSFESFVPWLLTLSVGVWIGAHVQSGAHGVSYVGTQGAVVFIMTLVQGFGPPGSILAGVERFAGITCGLLVVLAVSALTTAPGPTPLARSKVSSSNALPDT
jgi:uncharacterized membrane protein YgaE (UPF0421/DUF939 family)